MNNRTTNKMMNDAIKKLNEVKDKYITEKNEFIIGKYNNGNKVFYKLCIRYDNTGEANITYNDTKKKTFEAIHNLINDIVINKGDVIIKEVI